MQNCGGYKAYVTQPMEVNYWLNVFGFVLYIDYKTKRCFNIVKQYSLSFFNCECGRFLDGSFFLCGSTALISEKCFCFYI